MTPKVERSQPAFLQIADHFSGLIQDGSLEPDAKLPPIVDIAREWGVASATAAKAVKQLQGDGFVRSSSQGTFVDAGTKSPVMSFRATQELREDLTALARADGRDVEDILIEAARDWVRKKRQDSGF